MLSWASMPTRGLESKPSMRKGASVKGKWWSECPIGTTQGVDSMELFSCMVDDLEAELATAGVRGVQFIVDKGRQYVKNFDFDLADDITLLIEHEEEIQKHWIYFKISI